MARPAAMPIDVDKSRWPLAVRAAVDERLRIIVM
jgi:hypothetical protein